MPYPISKNKDGQYCVNGKCYDDKADAVKYQRALYANSKDMPMHSETKEDAKPKPKPMPKPKPKPKGNYATEDEVEFEGKYYDDYYEPASKIDPADERANYGPLRGSDTEACANCQWFNPKSAGCDIVWGDIVATGYCDLWLKMPGEYEPKPIPVVVVEGKETPIVGEDSTGQEIFPEGTVVANKARDPISGSKILTWLKNTFGVKQEEPLDGFGFKSLSNNKWVSYYTNSFQDKSKQILSEKAHDQYIEWVDKGLIPYPELWWWHVPGTRHGEAQWLGRVGHIVIAAGEYDDTPRAQAFRKEYEQNPYKVSHTFGFPPEARELGVYDAYFTVEISPLPAGKECNPITTFMEVKEMPVTDEKRARLALIIGEKDATEVIADAETISKRFEAIGLNWKEAEQVAATVITDKEARAGITQLATVNKAANDAVTDQIKTLALVIKELVDGEDARNKQVSELTTTVKEMFNLQPRASQAQQTVVTPNDPNDPMAAMAAFLQSKQFPQGTPQAAGGSVWDQIANTVLSGSQKAQNGGGSGS